MKMPKGLHLLALLAVVTGADGDPAQIRNRLVVQSLPICDENEYLVYANDGLICGGIEAANLSLPDCKSSGQLLTHIAIGDLLLYRCTGKGTEALSPGDITTINAQYQHVINQETLVEQVEQGMRKAPPLFCGQTASQPSAAFVLGTATGIAAAAALCASATGCSSGAHLCTVYDMYRSVAAGRISSAMDLSKSWVYQASWSQEFADGSGPERGSGLADNCGGFTVGDSLLKWYGTAVQWTTADSGQKALKFFSGPPNIGIPGTSSIIANPGSVECNSVLPIACCE